jgi:hypothetical protein
MSAGRTNRAGVLKLWVVNLLGNAVVLASWYWWLLIPDAHRWQIAWTVLQAIVTIIFVVWLRAGTLAWFRVAEFRSQPVVGAAFRRGARHMVPLAIWAALGGVIIWIVISLGNYTPQFGVWIRQKVTAGPSPRSVMHASDWLLFLLLWIVLPAVWIPVATTISASGFSGAHIVRSWRVLRRATYWVLLCVLMFCATWVPYKLVTWVPELTTMRQQAWSAGLRFFAAYLVMITAFIAVVWMVGEKTEREDPLP